MTEKGNLGGTDMKHFTAEDWIDFVNQAAPINRTTEMERHLESCKRCKETVDLWQKVKTAGAAEPKYQPPAESVRAAKLAFAESGWAAKPSKSSHLIGVLFDSFLQPELVGARSAAGMGMRQMLYRADPYQVDVQIEAKPEGNRLMVTGQLLNVSRSDFSAGNIQVTLSNRRGSIMHAVTNQFGEFRGEIDFSGDLELSFPRPEGKPIVISLRDALGRLPGGKS